MAKSAKKYMRPDFEFNRDLFEGLVLCGLYVSWQVQTHTTNQR
jgi:hypothetical protein